MRHVYYRPREVTVASDGTSAGLAVLLGVAALAAVAVAVAWFVVTYAVVLAIGAACGAALVAGGVYYLYKRHTGLLLPWEGSEHAGEPAPARRPLPQPDRPAIAAYRVIPGTVVGREDEERVRA